MAAQTRNRSKQGSSGAMAVGRAKKKAVVVSNSKPSRGNRVQYRCTLNPMRSAIDSIRTHLNPEHRYFINKTPFYHLLNAFIDNKVIFEKKTNNSLDSLIRSYTKCKGFRIGECFCFPTNTEVKLIFGIQDGKRPILDASSYSMLSTSLKQRFFSSTGRIKVKGLKALILLKAKQPGRRAAAVTVKLLCLLLIGTVFFATTGQTIAFAYLHLVDTFSRMCSFDWSSRIVKDLRSKLDLPWSNPRHACGCTIVLLYWFLERSMLVPPVVGHVNSVSSKQIPRLVKWNLSHLEGVITATSLHDMSGEEFNRHVLEPTVSEHFFNPSYVTADRISSGQVVVSDESSGEDTDFDSSSESDGGAAIGYAVCDDNLVVDDSDFDPSEGYDTSVHASAAAVVSSSSDFESVEADYSDADDFVDDSSDLEVSEDVVACSTEMSLDVGTFVQPNQVEAQVDCLENFNTTFVTEDYIALKTSQSSDDSDEVSASQYVVVPIDRSKDILPVSVVNQNALADHSLDIPLADPQHHPVKTVAQCSENQKSMVVHSFAVAVSDIPSFDLGLELSPPPPRASVGSVTGVKLSDDALQRLQVENLQLSTELEVLRNKFSLLESELSTARSFESELLMMTKKASDFEAQLIDVNRVVLDLNTKCVGLSLANEALSNERIQIRDDLLVRQTEKEELGSELAKIKAQLLQCQSKLTKQAGTISYGVQAERAALLLADKLNVEVYALKSLLSQKESEIGDFVVDIQGYRDTVAALKETVKMQEDRIVFLEKSKHDLERSLSSLCSDALPDNAADISGCVDSVLHVAQPTVVACPAASGGEPSGGSSSAQALAEVGLVSAATISSTPVTRSMSRKMRLLNVGDPGASLVKRVKHNHRERSKVNKSEFYFSEQKKNKRVKHNSPKLGTTVVKKPYFIPIENPIDESGKLVVSGDRFSYACGAYIQEDVYSTILRLNSEHGPAAMVWARGDGFLYVSLDSIMSILNDLYVDQFILEGVICLLNRCGFLDATCLVFSIGFNDTLQDCLRCKNFVHSTFLDMYNSILEGKKLIIPVCLSGNESRPFHWVVLTYKLGDKSWKLYDSSPLPIGAPDVFFTECKALLAQISKSLVLPSGSLPLVSKVSRVSSVPLQDNATNCALYAAFYIYKLGQAQSIPSVLEDESVQRWKGIVVNSLFQNQFADVPF